MQICEELEKSHDNCWLADRQVYRDPLVRRQLNSIDPKMEEEANESVGVTPEVFRNEDVLREIFKYLPTSTLISSCSLVNRLWREEARSFIRDKRECVVNLGIHISAKLEKEVNIWEQLCELDSVLRKMDTIPFNSLRVVITDSNTWCDEEVGKKTLTNLMSRIPLKYLSVIEEDGLIVFGVPRCPVASSILELVQENCSTLLEFESRSEWKGSTGGLFKDWKPPRFENLKKLSIAENSSITSDCAKKIICEASNLTAIHNNCLHMIPDVIPENMYGTLKRLAFGVEDVGRIEKFADKLDQLEELLVDFWGSDESEQKVRCVTLFHKLLTLNSLTLCSLGVRCHEDENFFDQLQLPLLRSVKVLCISLWSTFGFLTNISALNFRGSLPNLHQVYIRESDDDEYLKDYHGDDAGMLPEEDVIVPPNASESTLELTIDARVSVSDLETLRKLFPNVIKLSFTSPTHFPPLGLAVWPCLQSLSIFSGHLEEEQVGAQVFGLHPEEWKFLRQQDTEVLKKCQLVPSRPCVLTMRDLKHFQLEYRYRNPDVEAFLQLVEPLVNCRMPGLSFKMKQILIDRSWNTPRFRNLSEELFF